MVERSTPADPRVDVLVEGHEWRSVGAETPLVIDLPEYFAQVLDS